MTEKVTDSGIEVVLDNRKLIVAFAVLISICGGFFVLGFIEGKRQGYQAGMQTAAETAAPVVSDSASMPAAQTADSASDSKIAEAEAEKQPLNWYENINRKEEETQTASRAVSSTSPTSCKTPSCWSTWRPIPRFTEYGRWV